MSTNIEGTQELAPNHDVPEDPQSKARQGVLSEVEQLLRKAALGNTLTHPEIVMALRNLNQYNHMTEELLTAFRNDYFVLVKAIAQNEVESFALKTKILTILQFLEEKGLATQEELASLHDTKVLPGMLKSMGLEQPEAAASDDASHESQ